tara:strand:+ start:380 stop:775 length:396 start_codon:yes stop_codon:yes gene_type:complete
MSAVGKAASKVVGSLAKKGKEKLGVKTPKALNPGQKQIKSATKAQGVTQEATRLAKTKGVKTGLGAGIGLGGIAGAAAMSATKALSTLKTQDKQTTKNLSEFEKKFAKARKEGKPTFMFQNKKFTTKLRKK